MHHVGLLERVCAAVRPGRRFEQQEPFAAEADLVQQSSDVVDPPPDTPVPFQVAAISIAASEDEYQVCSRLERLQDVLRLKSA